MFKKIITAIGAIIGLSFGATIGPLLWRYLHLENRYIIHPLVNAILFGLIFMFLGSLLAPFIARQVRRIEDFLNQQTATTIILGTLGAVLGLLIGYIAGLPFAGLNIPFISTIVPFLLPIILGLVGYQMAMSRKDEIQEFFTKYRRRESSAIEGEMLERKVGDSFRRYKLLDTSVIIDGRIADIADTHFIEGVLIIPDFVLLELQHIADSADSLKRAKGRRGLDILNQLQKNPHIQIESYNGDFDDINEVDSKLIRLAKLMDAGILTNDYNLNKVCEFQNIMVYNINELANAVKPVLIPGEELTVQVIKAGTERKQGVAYLDDGTMIVVEDGQLYMNERIRVVVTSALQTNAGRMIFAKPHPSQARIESQ